MLNKFYLKYILFCVFVLLIALIIQSQKTDISLPVYLRDEIKIKENRKKEEYLIYVSDNFEMIFPLNIITRQSANFKPDFYHELVKSNQDKLIYMLYSLLTNYSNYLPRGVKTYIPKSSRIISYELNDNLLTLNLSKDFLDYSKKKETEMLKIITYTFTSIPNVMEVKLLCENKEVDYLNYDQETFKRDDFILNMFIYSTNASDISQYHLFYYTNIENNYYLVPTVIYDRKPQNSYDEQILKLLSMTMNIPLITFVNEKYYEKKDNSLIFHHDLSHYQYYLTCFENNIRENIDNIDIKKINFYEIELK